MTDFEFEIPKEIQALIAKCELGCTIKAKIKPKKDGRTQSEFKVEGGASASVLAIILLTAQVCCQIAAQDNDDPMKTWFAIEESARQVILDNSEEVKENGVCGQTT